MDLSKTCRNTTYPSSFIRSRTDATPSLSNGDAIVGEEDNDDDEDDDCTMNHAKDDNNTPMQYGVLDALFFGGQAPRLFFMLVKVITK